LIYTSSEKEKKQEKKKKKKEKKKKKKKKKPKENTQIAEGRLKKKMMSKKKQIHLLLGHGHRAKLLGDGCMQRAGAQQRHEGHGPPQELRGPGLGLQHGGHEGVSA
jgi:hypothetical protein